MWTRSLLAALPLLFIAPAARAQTASGDTQLAASHYQVGVAEYRAGHFARAADEFQHAYDLSHEPALLYNIGSARFDMGELAAARAAFEQYLAALPTAPNRAIVEARIASIQQRLAATSAPAPTVNPVTTPAPAPTVTASAAPVPASATPPPASSGTSVAPLVVAGVGVVGLALSAVFYGLRGGALSTCTEDPDAYRCPDQATIDRANTFSAASAISLGVGAVAAVGGIVWFVLSRSSDDRPPARTTVGAAPMPGGAYFTLGHAF